MSYSMRTATIFISGILSCAGFAEGGGNFALEELIVTAQKRVETMQEVPASFSVYSADSIESAGWDDITNMADLVPSIEVVGVTKSRTTIFIRSIGTNKYDIGTEGSIGIFVDGVYVPRFSSLTQNLIDLERVEVLRGPQGTLYGRNTIGGSISLYSKEPQQAFQGKITVGSGNKDSHHMAATVSGGITDAIVLYGGLTYREKGGFRKELNTGNSDDEETQAGRFKISYIPNDNWESSLTADWSVQKAKAFLGEATSPTGEVFALEPTTPQATIDALLLEEAEDFYTSRANNPGFTDVEALSVAFHLKYLNDDIIVESITGYRDETVEEEVDNDRTNFSILQQFVDQNSETISQEFKISSEVGGAYSMDDNLEWLAGVFFYQDKADRDDFLDLGIDSPVQALFSPGAQAFFGISPPYFLDFAVDLETSSWAIFGQATYYLTEEISTTLGIRFSRDTKEFSYTGTAEPALFLSGDIFSFEDTLRFESTDPKIVFEYEPLWAPDLNAYASYQQGYKSGGIQFFARRIETAQESFDKEILKAAEIGIKSRWMDQKLQINASTYLYDYSDQQIQAIVVFDGVTQVITTNAGSSTIKGFEADVMYLASPDILLQASYSYIDATFDEFLTPDGIDRSGNTLPAAPMHSYWVSGQYTQYWPGDWESVARVDYAWRDDQVFTPDGVFGQEDYGLLNASLTLTDPTQNLNIRLQCSNCADTKFRTSIIPLTNDSGWQASGGRRRYSVEAVYKF